MTANDAYRYAKGEAIKESQAGKMIQKKTPYEMVTFGLEYLWGRRENKDGADGTASRHLFSSRFAF